jgi:hypothetical protein
VTVADIARAAADNEAVTQAREATQLMAAIWGALSSTIDYDRRREQIERYGEALVKSYNTYARLMRKLGFEGPCG